MYHFSQEFGGFSFRLPIDIGALTLQYIIRLTDQKGRERKREIDRERDREKERERDKYREKERER